MAAAEPAPAAVMTWARGSTTFPAAQTPGTLVRPVVSVVTQPSPSTSQPRPTRRGLFGTKTGRHEQRVAGHDTAVVHLHAAQAVVLVDDQLFDGAFDDADGAGEQLGPLGGGEGVGWREVDEVVRPLAHDLGVPDGTRRAPDDAEPAVADLVAVAVGAVQDVAGPPVAEPGDVRQLVAQPGRDQQPPRRDPLTVGEEDPEPAAAVGHEVGDGAGDDLAAVPRDLVPAGGEQLGGWQAVAGEVAVHVGGRGVARLARVDHEDLAAGAGEDQGCGQAGGASADDGYVVMTHAPRLEPRGPFANERCRFRETGVR